MAPVVPDQRTRQGPKGRPILIVLIASLLLLGLYLVGLLIWSGTESPPRQAESPPPNPPAASAPAPGTPTPTDPARPVPETPGGVTEPRSQQ